MQSSFIQKRIERDAEFEHNFSLSGQQEIHVNIWDDFDPKDGTCVYITKEVPLSYQERWLLFLLGEIQSLQIVKARNAKVQLVIDNGAERNPSWLGTNKEVNLSYRWIIKLSDVDHDLVKDIYESLVYKHKNSVLSFEGVTLKIMCES